MDKLVIGCGYLGLRVAKRWLADGHRVWAVTRSASRALEFSQQGIRPIVADICDPASLHQLPAVQTLLFAVGYDRSSGKSQQEVYVDGLRNVLQQVVPQTDHFLYISSSSVYGQSDGEWVDEDSECRPVQAGGKCCLAAESLVRESFPSESRRSNALRLSGIYGPGRLLARVESLRNGEPISGQPDAWLNLIHVDDAAAAVLACETRGIPGQTYLVSDDQPVQRGEYYGLLATLCGAQAPRFDTEVTAARGSGGLNKRCRNWRLRRELKVDLAYPTISAGLPVSLESVD